VVVATADLLLHPVRLRIVQTFLGDRALTTAHLRDELPDIPLATLYRQMSTLVDAGILVVVAERPVRGTVERTYRLQPSAANVGPDEARAMTTEEHRRAFATFVAGLLADFDRYLQRDDVDLARDLVGYRQAALYLSDGELTDLLADLRAVIAPRLAHTPGPLRARRVLTTVLLPADPPASSRGSA
jgi:hypothetical protein